MNEYTPIHQQLNLNDFVSETYMATFIFYQYLARAQFPPRLLNYLWLALYIHSYLTLHRTTIKMFLIDLLFSFDVLFV